MSNELNELRALAGYLRPSGTVSIQRTDAGPLGLGAYEFRYRTAGRVDPSWPVTGYTQLCFVWNESTVAWTCSGTMFGDEPRAIDPKTWFYQISKAARMREQLLKGLLSKVAQFWERYRGDLEQFTYKLGVAMASTGQMERLADGRGWCWHHAQHSDVVMYFSPDTQPVGYGMLPQARFGFYAPASMHRWYMNSETLAELRDGIAKFEHDARDFCKGASACFGQSDSEQIQ